MTTYLHSAKLRVIASLSIGINLLSTYAAAEGNGDSTVDMLWLYTLPDWVYMGVAAALLAGIALLGLSLWRRFAHRAEQAEQGNAGKWMNLSVATVGAILGITAAVLLEDTWKSYLYEDINKLPPTSAGTYPVGMNITGLSDWSTQWIFVDLMKQSRMWITQDSVSTSSSAWDTKLVSKMPMDADYYPLQVPFTVSGVTNPQVVVTIIGNSNYPAGDYTFLANGQGDVSFSGTGVTFKKLATPITGSTLSYTVTLAPGHGYVIMKVNKSLSTDRLRNMRFIMPGFLTTYQTQPYHPTFLAGLKGMKVLRYMDYQATNNSPVTTVANTTKATTFTQAGPYGGSVEYIADLSNVTASDPWINIPHAADDAYVKDFATRLYNRLGKTRKVYIEYSNELWNYQFVQTTWLGQTACRNSATLVTDPTKNDYGVAGCDGLRSARKYHAMRASQIFGIFNLVFGADASTRLVNVAAAQAANTTAADQLLAAFRDVKLNPKQYLPNALAVAPYFAHSLANAIAQAKASSTITVDQILTYAGNSMTNSAFPSMLAAKQVADKYGVKLIAYEGGQHLVGTGGVENDDVLTQKLIAANRAPGMQALYEQYLNYWYQVVKGDVFVNFSNVSMPGKWGSWGVLEYQDQPTTAAPKAMAIQKVIAQ